MSYWSELHTPRNVSALCDLLVDVQNMGCGGRMWAAVECVGQFLLKAIPRARMRWRVQGAEKFKPLQEQSKLSKFRSMKYLRMRMIEISKPRNLHFGEVTICLWKQAIGLNENIGGIWQIVHHLRHRKDFVTFCTT